MAGETSSLKGRNEKDYRSLVRKSNESGNSRPLESWPSLKQTRADRPSLSGDASSPVYLSSTVVSRVLNPDQVMNPGDASDGLVPTFPWSALDSATCLGVGQPVRLTCSVTADTEHVTPRHGGTERNPSHRIPFNWGDRLMMPTDALPSLQETSNNIIGSRRDQGSGLSQPFSPGYTTDRTRTTERNRARNPNQENQRNKERIQERTSMIDHVRTPRAGTTIGTFPLILYLWMDPGTGHLL
jgi:hypothetical protein